VGVLGILKAGGAYVPLDPAYPKERLAFMLADASISILLTQTRLLDSLPETQAQVMCLDTDWPTIAQSVVSSRPSVASNPPSPISSDHLAYVIYTSGSTGRPKGVQIPHRAVVNFLSSMREQPGLTQNDVLLSVTTLAFDIAGLELFLPLTVGACVVLVSRDIAADGTRLSAELIRTGATVMQATPATWRLLLEAGWRGNPNLKILCGGEALPRELADHLVTKGSSLWNLYGPTETTIWSIAGQVEVEAGPVVLGRPIANTQIYILDAQLNTTPLGVPGELYIGGDGLAWGYLHRPELTAEKFIPHPFTDSGSRLYGTGDLARWRADGTLEFLGRLDHQVKVRGYRIELAEIESVLRHHPSVQDCVVVAREMAGDKRLVAYLVLKADRSAAVLNELRAWLRAKLPDYMLPAAYMILESLPLTPNGKVNRRALPAPEGAAQPERAFAAPRGELERTIAQIWQEVLGVEQVGLHDNFFDLGGHSLLMARVHRRLRNVVPHNLTMVELFQYPTVGALARYLSPTQDEHPVAVVGHARTRRRRELGQRFSTDIAVIGLAGRFPGAPTLDAFWHNLCAGVEAISFFTDEEIKAAGVDLETLHHPHYVRAGGVLDEVEWFDAAFFGYTPREAEILDPQHRLFLECAWEALERAGYDSARYSGRIGVYASAGLNTYLLNNLQSHPDLLHSAGGYQTFISNDKDFVPTRVSYKLNLRGPSVTVQTACSSSLVAIHLACQSLLSGECEMALAGGVSLNLPQKTGYIYQERGIASPDGHCRAFDARAQGTVRGSGAGVVVLKRLAEALTDGDPITAIIKGSAINNDGSLKVGYTAPSVDGQAEVIAEALALADIDPETVSYVEAHGTGTELGDPIEVAALTQAFGVDWGQSRPILDTWIQRRVWRASSRPFWRCNTDSYPLICISRHPIRKLILQIVPST
jgi:polyketide synthase PksJ